MDLRITVILLGVEPGNLKSADEIGKDAASQLSGAAARLGVKFGPLDYSVGKVIVDHDEIPPG